MNIKMDITSRSLPAEHFCQPTDLKIGILLNSTYHSLLCRIIKHGKYCIFYFYTQYTDTRKIFLTKNMAHFSFLSPWLNFFSKSILRLFVSRVSVLYSRGMFSLFSETLVRSLETWWNSRRIILPVCQKKTLKRVTEHSVSISLFIYLF